jgi:crotonobetainyl-CoA:carnitine CoA-transferase CaiB-like acyl-CoA transferase
VLDLTVALAGPYCTLLLAAMGAEVIKIEGPQRGEIARTNPPFFGDQGFHFDGLGEGDVSLSILNRARNKQSITLDLKSEVGRELFMRLARQSDVVVENMSDGTAERLGVGYEAVRQANPEIIYASISGLGDPSPLPGLKAMDIIVQALSGVMDVTGFADGPPVRFGLPIADLLAPLFATSGVLAAVIQRNGGGGGQHVKVGMLDALASLLPVEHFDVLGRSGLPTRGGNHMNRLSPFGVFQTNDGYVAIAAAADEWVWSLFEAMGRSDLRQDPRFNARGARALNAQLVNDTVEAWTRTLSAEAVVRALHEERGVPCARVRSVAEVLEDPHLRRTGAIQTLVDPRRGPIDAVGMGFPMSFSNAQVGLDKPAPELGASNDAVFGELLGLTEAERAELKAKGVI